jgi:hypothetical protein
LNEADNPLNAICYIWWDVFPAQGDPKDASRSEEDLRHVAAVSRQPDKVTVYFPGPVGPNLSTYSAVEP